MLGRDHPRNDMAEGQQNGRIDLEKELTCSICTEVLYQPLTLLDCLHTFCGACLKEWFYFQASTATSIHPYTCPQCRASVRATQQDARVNTLLDLYLSANPDRAKSDQDKEDVRKHYKPGDNVMPKLRKKRRETAGEAEDRRIMDQVRELSLHEVGVSNNALEVPRERTRDRSRRREASQDNHRSRTESSRSRSRDVYLSSPPIRSPRQPAPTSPSQIVGGPTLEHQSSLRSILSASEFDSQEIREEIMRQIMEDGLLDGIDFDNLDAAQEEEITQRIADAYRRRHDAQREERRLRAASGASNPPSSRDGQQTRRRHHARSESGGSRGTHPRPPVSRPHLLASQSEHQRRPRSNSNSSARSGDGRSRQSSEAARPAARSATDLTNNPQSSRTSAEDRRRLSQNDRRATDPERLRAAEQLGPKSSLLPNASNGSPRLAGSRFIEPTTSHSNHSSPSLVDSRNLLEAPSTAARPSSSGQTTPSRPSLFTEPSISCNRCGKSHIEYDVHYNCSKCEEGKYNLCLRCYRTGKGCLHWFGFGEAAQIKYERHAPPGGYPPNHEQPHILTGHCYLRPRQEPLPASAESRRVVADDDPAKRLQSGVFCDICQSFANPCYWKCDECNDGVWGFCNTCVNQGRHCTHPLLPLSRITPSQQNDSSLLEVPGSTARTSNENLSTPVSTPPSSPPLTPKSASISRGPGHVTIANLLFRPLTFTTHCDVCAYPIPPSNTRYHCPHCNDGDYDICVESYLKLVASGTIPPENGHRGWRRCLQGHRMVIVGFEDRDGGQRRVVSRDLVGGLFLKDEDVNAAATAGADAAPVPEWHWRDPDGSRRTHRKRGSLGSGLGVLNNRFPPDGGVGMRLKARWAWWPQKGAVDELMFPKGAEIREAEDINGDWLVGCYAGSKGLFPGGYGRPV